MKKHTLIIVSGHAGAGKTTLAKKISDKFRLPLVSPDGVKEIIWNNIPKQQWADFGSTGFELMYY